MPSRDVPPHLLAAADQGQAEALRRVQTMVRSARDTLNKEDPTAMVSALMLEILTSVSPVNLALCYSTLIVDLAKRGYPDGMGGDVGVDLD